MSTAYELALAEWGAQLIEADYAARLLKSREYGYASSRNDPPTISIDRSTVYVSFEFSEGFHHGSSQDESADASVEVRGTIADDRTFTAQRSVRIEPKDFDFAKVVIEIGSIADRMVDGKLRAPDDFN